MALAVVTVGSGGRPVCDNSGLSEKRFHGIAVSEAANGYGIPVTKVPQSKGGMPVIYVVPTPQNP